VLWRRLLGSKRTVIASFVISLPRDSLFQPCPMRLPGLIVNVYAMSEGNRTAFRGFQVIACFRRRPVYRQMEQAPVFVTTLEQISAFHSCPR
jgi:hypothetical protein